jgi:hypothetical protein
MTRVKIGEHILLNLSRRSLCDNCIADICLKDRSRRILECEDYRPPFLVLRRCAYCGELFDVFRNIRALDQDLCPYCNAFMAKR